MREPAASRRGPPAGFSCRKSAAPGKLTQSAEASGAGATIRYCAVTLFAPSTRA
jgi:hypothetical protein